MTTIELKPDLYETLKRNAADEVRTINDLVNDAVESYVRNRQESKIETEIMAFAKMHSKLRQKFLGQWVVIHNQELVDQDADRVALFRRVRAKYGPTAVLIRQVCDQIDNESWLRTPSTWKDIA
ncbi:MAG: hypothetical protein AB1791_02655 [Chloroflexota bacterium]